MSHYFIQKLSVNYSASFVSSKMKDSCQEWKVKLIFSRRRKQFDGLIWLTLTLNPPPPYILRQIYATANANVSITSLTKVMKRNWNRKPQEQTKLRVLLRAHDIQQDRINTTGHSQRNTQQPRPAVRAWNIHDCISTKKTKPTKTTNGQSFGDVCKPWSMDGSNTAFKRDRCYISSVTWIYLCPKVEMSMYGEAEYWHFDWETCISINDSRSHLFRRFCHMTNKNKIKYIFNKTFTFTFNNDQRTHDNE